MSLKNCSVVYHESPQGIYSCGQVVSGVFNMKQEHSKKVLGITLEVIGEAKTRWKGKYLGKGKHKKNQTFEGHDIYYRSPPVNVTDNCPRKDRWCIVKEGLTTFNFAVQLHPLLPSTYEGRFGRISYYVKVAVQKNAKREKSIEFPFTVIGKNDLSLSPLNNLPINNTISKKYSFFNADVGILVITTDLPTTGYVPGQQIPIDCYINNSSKVPVSHFLFSLERIATYYATTPCGERKTERHRLVEAVEKAVIKETESRFRVILVVPNIPPSSLSNNSIITLEYVVKVHAKVKGVFSHLKGDIPIKIGTGSVPAQTPYYSGDIALPSININSSNLPLIDNYPTKNTPPVDIGASGSYDSPSTSNGEPAGLPTYEQSQDMITKRSLQPLVCIDDSDDDSESKKSNDKDSDDKDSDDKDSGDKDIDDNDNNDNDSSDDNNEIINPREEKEIRHYLDI